ncbi:Sodium/hydrogen exchanger family-domain-containing protein [Auriculariales sp. MPI-PUGE-AT-0066]|nr:Sodium/hydrogen exchanger family-domain-containing protein [Auriculariales sp. MPI-PUGE-AT-0066]
MTVFAHTAMDVAAGALRLVARQSANATAPAKAPSELTPLRVNLQGGLLNGQDPTKYDTKNPVRLLFIEIGIILVFTQLLAVVLRKVRQPKVIAEVIGGILLGPSVMGHIPGFSGHIFPKDFRPYLAMVAQFGLCMFLFIVGMELDTTFLRRNMKLSVMIGMGGMLVPFGVGAGFSTVLYSHYVTPATDKTHFLVFIGVCFSITAFPVLCRILTALQLLDTTVGISVLAAGVGNDIIAWVLLALAVSLVNAVNGITAFYIFLCTIAWAGVVLFPGRIGLHFIARKTGSLENGPTPLFLTILLLFVFASAFFTDIIGVHPIFGAFLVGISVPRDGGLNIYIIEKLDDLIMIVFLPLYFTLSGLNTNLSELNSGKDWGFIIAIAVLDFSGKFISTSGMARLAGFKVRESAAVGSLMSCKGLVELIVLNVGLTAGILDTRLFSMFVVEALLLTAVTSPLVSAIYPPHLRTKVVGGKIVTAPAGDNERSAGDLDKDGDSRRSLEYEEDDETTWKSRYLAVLDKAGNLPALMSFTQIFQPQLKTSNPDSKRMEPRRPSVDVLRLIELSDRTAPVMQSQHIDTLIQTDPVVSVFRTFTGLADLSGSSSIAVVSNDDFAKSVNDHVAERNSQLVLTAWTLAYHTNNANATHSVDGSFGRLGGELASAEVQANFLRNVFLTSSVDVALYVEPGFIGAQAFGHGGKKHIFLPFFGGPDDRLALKVLVQLAASNPNITATVLRVTKAEGANIEMSTTSPPVHDTAASAPGVPDTVYGNVGTQFQLQSETADNVLWSKLQTSSTTRSVIVQDALKRITFSSENSSKPLSRVAEAARATKQTVEAHEVAARFVVFVGRSRRLATDNHAKELSALVQARGSSAVGTDVRRTLGDVASALVLSDISAGLVVLQASVGAH